MNVLGEVGECGELDAVFRPREEDHILVINNLGSKPSHKNAPQLPPNNPIPSPNNEKPRAGQAKPCIIQDRLKIPQKHLILHVANHPKPAKGNP